MAEQPESSRAERERPDRGGGDSDRYVAFGIRSGAREPRIKADTTRLPLYLAAECRKMLLARELGHLKIRLA